MKIFEIILFEYLLGYVLQAFTLVLGLYAFNKCQVDRKKYIFVSIIMTAVIYLTRLLPITFGVHTILDFVIAFLLAILYLKFSAVRSVIALIVDVIIILLTEISTSLILQSFLGREKFLSYTNDSLYRYILGIPSSLVTTLIIACIYFFSVINKKRCFDETA